MILKGPYEDIKRSLIMIRIWKDLQRSFKILKNLARISQDLKNEFFAGS